MAETAFQELLRSHNGKIYEDAPIPQLIEMSIKHDEGSLSYSGALCVSTGSRTGRSPYDKYIVDSPDVRADIWWENNKKMSQANFTRLYKNILSHLSDKDLFVFNGFAGADPSCTLPLQIINEFAWQSIFVQQLFIRSADTGWKVPQETGFTVICAPGAKASPSEDQTNSETFIVINFAKRLILIGGTLYAGEIKKAIFSVINYLLPKQNILSMQCSANRGMSSDVALFFGLSGTGKTTLSADPDRFLIGDDEHCWGKQGIFNVEGGCYAKCIRLDCNTEPQIWDAIKFGTVLENVVLNPKTGQVDYDDGSITENTRATYPVHFIPESVYPGIGKHPHTIVFLTADAFGVLPPVSRLTPNQALYYFLSGYTSKLTSAGRGLTEPTATFSPCFAAPFLPLHPMVYANLLKEKIDHHDTHVYLVNTGWQGGSHGGTGKRISLSYTRRIISAAVDGYLDYVDCKIDPIFNLPVPVRCPSIPDSILHPAASWSDPKAYEKTARHLASMFAENCRKFSGVPEEIIAAGPAIR